MVEPAFQRVQFVVNARHRRPAAAAALDRLRVAAERAFPGAAWRPTCGPGHAVALAREAVADGADLVVAVGGDGTINEVVNGLMEWAGTEARPHWPVVSHGAPEAGRSLAPPALGIVPSGSGSDFARSLAIPRDATAALEVLSAGRLWRIDVGEIRCAPLEGRHGGPLLPHRAGADEDRPGLEGVHAERVTRFFVNVAGCGASARVTERFNRRRIPGAMGYAVAAALTTLDYRWPRVHIVVDGGERRAAMLNTFFACNGQYCGGGMHVGRDARLDDGLLLVVEATGIGRLRTILEWPRLYGGRLARIPGVRTMAARRVELRSEDEVLVDCDGEVCGRLPATYSIVPGALTVVGGRQTADTRQQTARREKATGLRSEC